MPFEIKLKLQNDPELRKYIKSLLRGQVESITREDIRASFLPEMVNRTFSQPAALKEYVKNLLRDEVKKAFEEGMHRTYGGINPGLHEFMQECVREEVKKIVNKELDGVNLSLKGARK